MTQVNTTMRTAYLAGPMRGYEEYNFPAFKAAASWLRDEGWEIFSPAERDEAEGFNAKTDKAHSLDYYMQFDLPAVCTRDAVICLPGWEDSQGARLEAMVAVELGHPVFEITGPSGTGLARHKKNGSLVFGDAQLSSVSPDYVKAIFLTESMGMFAEEACGCQVEEEFRPATENSACSACPYDDNTCQVDGCERVRDALEHVLSEDCPCEPRVEWVPSTLPADSGSRKSLPITTGVLDYFPAALIEVAKVSKAGNDKHNPGQPLHHARGKSTDHADSLLRHLVDRGKLDGDTGCRHSAEVAWRALAMLQQELEDEGLAPLPRGARLPD